MSSAVVREGQYWKAFRKKGPYRKIALGKSLVHLKFSLITSWRLTVTHIRYYNPSSDVSHSQCSQSIYENFDYIFSNANIWYAPFSLKTPQLISNLMLVLWQFCDFCCKWMIPGFLVAVLFVVGEIAKKKFGSKLGNRVIYPFTQWNYIYKCLLVLLPSNAHLRLVFTPVSI